MQQLHDCSLFLFLSRLTYLSLIHSSPEVCSKMHKCKNNPLLFSISNSKYSFYFHNKSIQHFSPFLQSLRTWAQDCSSSLSATLLTSYYTHMWSQLPDFVAIISTFPFPLLPQLPFLLSLHVNCLSIVQTHEVAILLPFSSFSFKCLFIPQCS